MKLPVSYSEVPNKDPPFLGGWGAGRIQGPHPQQMAKTFVLLYILILNKTIHPHLLNSGSGSDPLCMFTCRSHLHLWKPFLMSIFEH